MDNAATAENNYLELSDDDFLNAPLPKEPEKDEEAADAAAAQGGGEADDAGAAGAAEAGDEDADGDEATGDDDKSDDDDSNDDDADKDDSDDADSKDADEKGDGDDKADAPDPVKDFYDKITAPFKANGREMKVDSAEDAVRLMQMGANYNKKMAALKPGLKILKMLEKHELLDEGKLGFLIDLNKKDAAAIAKLVKDANIDPLDLEKTGTDGYQPNTYTVDDAEIDLDEAIADLRETTHGAKVIQLVGTKWDGPSKQVVANSPQLLTVLSDHMASGVYDLISQEVEKERVLGKLKGLSDIAAYKQVGDAIQERGGFDHLFKKAPAAETPPPQKKTVVVTKSKSADPALDAKRKAASPPKQTTAGKQPDPDFSPLAMSDEEFERQSLKKFL